MLQRWEQFGVGFWTRPWLAVLAAPFSRIHTGLSYTVVAGLLILWNHLRGTVE